MEYLRAVGQKDEIKSVAVSGGQCASGDLLLKQLQDGIVFARPAGSGEVRMVVPTHEPWPMV